MNPPTIRPLRVKLGHDGRGNFAGTVAAANNQIDIGVASVTADATIDGGTGAINTAALTVADTGGNTVGTGAVGAPTIASVTGANGGGAASNLSLNSTGVASVPGQWAQT